MALNHFPLRHVVAAAALCLGGHMQAAQAAWEPTKPVEFVVPAVPVAAPIRWPASSRAWWPRTS